MFVFLLDKWVRFPSKLSEKRSLVWKWKDQRLVSMASPEPSLSSVRPADAATVKKMDFTGPWLPPTGQRSPQGLCSKRSTALKRTITCHLIWQLECRCPNWGFYCTPLHQARNATFLRQKHVRRFVRLCTPYESRAKTSGTCSFAICVPSYKLSSTQEGLWIRCLKIAKVWELCLQSFFHSSRSAI